MHKRSRSLVHYSTLLIALLFASLLPARAHAGTDRISDAWRYGFVDDHIQTSDVAIQHAKDAGLVWVKYLLFWSHSNPTHIDCNHDGRIDATDDCNFDWSLPDVEIQRLANAGMHIYVHISYPPTWTTGATYPNGASFYCYDENQGNNVRTDDDANCNNSERRPGYRAQYTPDHYPASYDRSEDFKIFVEAAVRRYKDRVRTWGFGVEVHSRLFWQGSYKQFFDEILLPGYQTVKGIDPTLLVVGPEEDQYEERPGEIGAFEYLLNFEVTTGHRVFDVLTFHFLSQTIRGDLEDVLDTKIKPMVDRTRRGRPFWLTETGYWSGGGIVDDFQRAWLQRVLTGIAARPWIDKTFIYRLMDTTTFDFGILNEDGSPKPAFTAIEQFLSTQAEPRFYYLAEGATKSFFNLDIAVANPNDAAAPLKISYLKPDGTVTLQTPTLAAKSRLTIHVDSIAGLENADVSTIIESTGGLPLAVERTMFWDVTRYGGHTDTAVQAPALKWYFAEGAQGFFDTYVLFANSNIVPAQVHVTFLLQDHDPIEKIVPVGATSRGGFCACDYPELNNQSFGMLVESDQPIIAERAMYFGRNPFWSAGHESAGVTAPATDWFLAEGHTGPFFDEYVLVSNPNDNQAAVNVQFVTPGGQTVMNPGNPLILPGKSRTSIYVDAVPGLENTAVSTRITSNLPVVAERAMYWPGTPGEWYESHNSFGLTETGTKWVLGEGRSGNGGQAGTDPGFESYILVYNTTAAPAHIKVTYLLEGAAAFTYEKDIPKGRDDIIDPDARLMNHSYGALIESDQPIVVERAMYWRGVTGRPWGWGGSNATAVKLQ